MVVASVLVTLVWVLLTMVAQQLCNGALIKSVSESYLGNEVTVGQAYRFVLPKILTLIVASLVVGIVVGIGMLLCIVPGIIFGLWFALTIQAIVVEDLKAFKGMGRSKWLASGNLGRIFAVGLVVVLIALILGWVFGLAGGLLATQFGGGEAGNTAGLVVNQVFSLAAQILAMPIGATAYILLYYDLRIRKEGFDLEMLARRMGSGETPSDATSPI